jgi:hypothetical protein
MIVSDENFDHCRILGSTVIVVLQSIKGNQTNPEFLVSVCPTKAYGLPRLGMKKGAGGKAELGFISLISEVTRGKQRMLHVAEKTARKVMSL